MTRREHAPSHHHTRDPSPKQIPTDQEPEPQPPREWRDPASGSNMAHDRLPFATTSDPAMKKSNLPTKTCAACSRPFAWRKKWERDWDNVRYCSDACRRGVHPLARKAKGS